MAQHSSIIGGSSAARVINCPGSVALSAKMPKGASSTYANEGTMLHEVMTRVFEADESIVDDLIGLDYEGEIFTTELRDEMILPAIEAYDAIDRTFGPFDFTVEQRVGFTAGKLAEVDAFGTADLIGVSPTHSLVLDWKFGRGVEVKTEGNMQALFYAAAAAESPDVKDMFDPNKAVVIAIVQPAFEPTYNVWETDHATLAAFRNAAEEAVKEVTRGSTMLEVGSHCRFCPAVAVCPEKTGRALEAIQLDRAVMTPEKLGDMLTLSNDLEVWIEALRELGHTQLEAGLTVPGWKLVGKRASRKWLDEVEVEARFRKLRVKVGDFYEKKFISPAKAEKLLKKLKKPQAAIEGLFHSVSSGTTIAPDDDKRQAVFQGATALEKMSAALK